MQKFREKETTTSLETDRERILARSESVLRSMSLSTRDAQGYPISGIDVVPHYPQKPPTRIGELTLLQQANRREDLKETVEYWRKRYKTLYQDHMA